MIDKNSPLSLYQQLEEAIKSMIQSGELPPGSCLPPETEYAQMYGISRMTVRQAISNLVNQGYLYRRRGKGTFVTERKIAQELQLTSFTEDMLSRGMTPGSRLLKFELIAAPSDIAALLHTQEYEPVYHIQRVRLADGIPMALEISYIPANLVKGLTDEIVMKSVYQYIEHDLNLKISYSTQEIEAGAATKRESSILEIDTGTPVMRIQRHTFLRNEIPLEIVRSVYRGDRYKFVTRMSRNGAQEV